MKNALLIAFVLLLAFGCLGEYEGKSVDESALYAPSAYGGGEYVTKESFIEIEVPEGTLQTKYEEMSSLLETEGAELSSIEYYEYSYRKQYSVTIKVRPAKFDEVNKLLQEIGEVKQLSVELEDVTEEYVDLETRINGREIELERLYTLYNMTDDVSELLEIGSEMARVETELELLKQDEHDLISKVEYSTITIILYEEKSQVEQIAISLEDLVGIFVGAFVAAIMLIVAVAGFIIPIAIVFGGLWFAYKKVNGKKVKSRRSGHDRIPPPQ
ncbi:DUF4349 domain-containing protein [Candidatus Micrarchaeota archaeon]|nr:DUF4349 domain-containing protein [Candidatus Micrarchaeota archaeon]